MYRIVGADQKEYGPVTQEQIAQWIREGRANGQTIARLEEGPWKPLSTFPEFQAELQAQGPPPLASGPPTLPAAPGRAGTYAAPGLPSNGLATAGLIVGVLGFLQCCTPLFAIVGLILSGAGLYQIQANPGRYSGKPLAVAGLVLSALGLVIFGVLLLSGLLEDLANRLQDFGGR